MKQGFAKDADTQYGPALIMDAEESDEAAEDYLDMDSEEADDGIPKPEDGDLIDFQGVQCCIEYHTGEIRPFSDQRDNGSPMGFPVLADYGYIPGTISTEDGEERDVFIGPDKDCQRVFVVQLRNPGDPQTLMEEKVLLGFCDLQAAQDFCCLQYYPEMIENIYEYSLQDLKDQVEMEKPKAATLRRKMIVKQSQQLEREAQDDRIAEVSGFTGEHTGPFVVVQPADL